MSERILIVEDDKTLSKLLKLKIEASFDAEIDVAYTFSEAKLFMARYKYFIAVLDLHLPDAPHGEIVDYATEKKVHAIVLSSHLNKEFRELILKKNIIDYINKGGMEDVDYAVQTIERLKKNKEHTALVVDDSMMFRKQMQAMLENLFFKVIAVGHGEEALNMLKERPEISLVLTDYNMPVMDGMELTKEVRKTYNKNELCLLAISSNEDDETTALFLKYGANDYIKKPYSKEEFVCRVHNSIDALENIQKLTNFANRDYLTGLYNRRHFFNALQEHLIKNRQDKEEIALGMIDIDHFKKVNDTYGHDTGDKIIIALADILRSATSPYDIVSRFGGEEFCVVLKNINQFNAENVFERIRDDVENFAYHLEDETIVHFTVSIGAVMYNLAESMQENINEADLLLYKAKNNGRNQVIFQA